MSRNLAGKVFEGLSHAGQAMRWFQRSRLLVVLGGLSLIVGAVAVWGFQARPLGPTEVPLVGAWLTPTQPDGSSTVLILNPDRTCRIRWLDATGGEDMAS